MIMLFGLFGKKKTETPAAPVVTDTSANAPAMPVAEAAPATTVEPQAPAVETGDSSNLEAPVTNPTESVSEQVINPETPNEPTPPANPVV
jgi:hypothetical protein